MDVALDLVTSSVPLLLLFGRAAAGGSDDDEVTASLPLVNSGDREKESCVGELLRPS